ncbi:hypothetical protein CPLU01_10018 [Colletotrichum plurivorum]|uniref:Uncharacterized protein n=1 Tax=Colletotrichum plurivorum TaxID=2175906 RepID=A0A8H6K7U1_9PEZI|nr:hypothetical protein CPLU01_10018 [Colletotrichum plurivorum]
MTVFEKDSVVAVVEFGFVGDDMLIVVGEAVVEPGLDIGDDANKEVDICPAEAADDPVEEVVLVMVVAEPEDDELEVDGRVVEEELEIGLELLDDTKMVLEELPDEALTDEVLTDEVLTVEVLVDEALVDEALVDEMLLEEVLIEEVLLDGVVDRLDVLVVAAVLEVEGVDDAELPVSVDDDDEEEEVGLEVLEDAETVLEVLGDVDESVVETVLEEMLLEEMLLEEMLLEEMQL